MTKKITLTQFALGLSMMLSATSLLAQSTNGTIHGTVLDPSGALVPKAQITVSSANGFSRTIQSGPTGAFAVSNLAPGSYSVSINAAGFTPALEGGIQVAGNKVTEDNVKLGISVNQVVEVTANDTDVVSKQDDAAGDSSNH